MKNRHLLLPIIALTMGALSACNMDSLWGNHVVTFESNGGTYIEPQEVPHNKMANRPIDPKKEGCAFDYWQDEYGGHYDFENMPVLKDITLFAIYEVGYVTVSFDSLGGTPIESQKVKIGDYAIAPITNPTKEKNTFIGWYDAYGYPWYFDQYPITVHTTLYAGWEDSSCYVTFNSNGGTSVESQHLYEGDLITKPTDPVYEGHSLDGWYLDNGKKWDFEKDTLKTSITLTAKWNTNAYTVSVTSNDDNMGTVSGGGIYSYGSEVVLTATANDGCEFDGWYQGDFRVSQLEQMRFVMPDKNVSFEARFVGPEATTIEEIVALDETGNPALLGQTVSVIKGYHYESYDGNKFILNDAYWDDFDADGVPNTYDEQFGLEVVLASGKNDIVLSDGSEAFCYYCNVIGTVSMTSDDRIQLVDASVSFWNNSESDSKIGYFLYNSVTSSTEMVENASKQTVGRHISAQITIQSNVSITQKGGGSFTYSISGESTTYTCYIPGSLTNEQFANYQQYANFKKGEAYSLYMSTYWSNGICTMLMPKLVNSKKITKIDVIATWSDIWEKASVELTEYANNEIYSAGHLEKLPDLSGLTVNDANEFSSSRDGVYYGNSEPTVLVDVYDVKCMGNCTESTISNFASQLEALGYTVEDSLSSYDGETEVKYVEFGINEEGSAMLTADIYLDDTTMVVQFFYWFMAAQ